MATDYENGRDKQEQELSEGQIGVNGISLNICCPVPVRRFDERDIMVARAHGLSVEELQEWQENTERRIHGA